MLYKQKMQKLVLRWQQVLWQLSHMSDIFYTAETGKYDVRDIRGKLIKHHYS